MSVHKIGSDTVRPLPKRDGSLTGRKTLSDDLSPPGQRERADRVELSEEALALAARGDLGTDEISAQRLDTVRERITRGFYDDPAVREEVARRLLASGEMDLDS